jgi:hypothetical protein
MRRSSMPDPTIEIVDERRLTVPKSGLGGGATEQVGKFIVHAGQDGYVLADMREERVYEDRPGGGSRLSGVTLIFRKAS